MSIASKWLLVIGPEDGLVAAVAQELDAGNMPVTFVADHVVDWENRGAVEKLFGKQAPYAVLHEVALRQPDLLESNKGKLRAAVLKRSQMLATVCAKRGCIAVHLSDYHVFGGDTKNAYDEADPAAPLDSYGQWIAALEQAFVTSLDQHLILRLSWVIDAEGNNLLTRILEALVGGRDIVLSRYRRGAPTWRSDARRVICGVVRQVMTGAENWGFFHYCSSDSCNEWEFGREVESTLSELRTIGGKVVAQEVKDGKSYPLEPASATLNSRRIRNNFGVHGRSWRQGLKAQISHWLEIQAESEAVSRSAN